MILFALLSAALHAAGYPVAEVLNGRESLWYRSDAGGLGHCDMVMPEWNGLNMITKLTREGFGIKIIAKVGILGDEYMK